MDIFKKTKRAISFVVMFRFHRTMRYIRVVDAELSIMKKIIIKGTSINIIVNVLIRLIVIGLELSRVE